MLPLPAGHAAAGRILQRLPTPHAGDRQRLLDVGLTMTEASLCGLGHTAAIAVMSAIEKFPELFHTQPLIDKSGRSTELVQMIKHRDQESTERI